MELTVKIQAPEIAAAIVALANAIGTNAKETLSAKNALATTITVLADVVEDAAKGASAEGHTQAAPAAEEPAKTEKKEQKEQKANKEEKDPQKQEDPAVEIPSVVDLRAKAQEKGKTPQGKKAIKALLDEFGSKSISDVPEEVRVAFMSKLEAL